MGVNECDFKHEDLCIAEPSEGFKCPHAKGEILKECTAKEEDLVEGCQMCESEPANAKFPYEEYCKECAKEMEIEEKGVYIK